MRSTTDVGFNVALLEGLMAAQGMKPRDLANAIGVTPEAVAHWLKGNTPKAQSVIRMAELFGRDVWVYDKRRPERSLLVAREELTP